MEQAEAPGLAQGPPTEQSLSGFQQLLGQDFLPSKCRLITCTHDVRYNSVYINASRVDQSIETESKPVLAGL